MVEEGVTRVLRLCCRVLWSRVVVEGVVRVLSLICGEGRDASDGRGVVTARQAATAPPPTLPSPSRSSPVTPVTHPLLSAVTLHRYSPVAGGRLAALPAARLVLPARPKPLEHRLCDGL